MFCVKPAFCMGKTVCWQSVLFQTPRGHVLHNLITSSYCQTLSKSARWTLIFGILTTKVCILDAPNLAQRQLPKGIHTTDMDTRTVWHTKLDSCPWGPATAHVVSILTELYVIYTYQKSGPLVHWRQQERWLRTDGQNHRPLLWMNRDQKLGPKRFYEWCCSQPWVWHIF